MIGIYKIESPSGRIYIGQSINIERRKDSYSKLQDCKKQTRLYNSLKKYGFDHHTFEVVEQCLIEQLNERERYWQDYYNVLLEGLNCKLTKTSDRSGYFSEESKQKNSTSNKGRIPWNKNKQIGKISNEEKQRRGWGKVVQCNTCNTALYRQMNQLTGNQFCSRACYTSFRTGQDLGGKVNTVCKHCDTVFVVDRYLQNKSKHGVSHCSADCCKSYKRVKQ